VRYQGGSNAGHTIVFGGQTYKLSLVPSGILSPHVQCIVTGGVVINPASILQEIDGLTSRGIEVAGRLMLSDRAHVIFPWHIAEDRAMDKSCSSGENIGTTMRGIGPCYADKVGRSHAVRLGDLYRDDIAQKIAHIAAEKRMRLTAIDGELDPPLDAQQIIADYAALAKRLKPYVGDTTATLFDAMDQDKRVLFEGAQGALLDIDHGTFPFVTSSNSSGVGVCSGSGVAPRYIQRVIGVVKAYTTRVGGGPFPTEQDNEIGQHIRDRGNEYGTVTRRPRRCGWFDAVAARYTARLSGVDSIAVMLLDVLAMLPELKICTAYEIDGHRITQFPSHVDDLRKAVPIYETLPGWRQEITAARRMSDLPENAHKYLQRISELVGRPVEVVSIGPDREQTILAGEWAQSLKA
jgi:adenylosuccinate synthase